MKRSVFVIVACVVGLVGSAGAQTKQPTQAAATKAAPTTGSAAPATPAKFAKIIKGNATVDIFSAPSKKVGNDMVTVMKVKNTSDAAIAGFKVEEYWYDKKPKPENVTGDTQIYKKPIQPGEIVEITMKSPLKPGIELYQSKYQFTHANGAIQPTRVKKM